MLEKQRGTSWAASASSGTGSRPGGWALPAIPDRGTLLAGRSVAPPAPPGTLASSNAVLIAH